MTYIEANSQLSLEGAPLYKSCICIKILDIFGVLLDIALVTYRAVSLNSRCHHMVLDNKNERHLNSFNKSSIIFYSPCTVPQD